MPYSFGQATDYAGLLVALKAACAAGGWTVAGDVISKGDCFVAFTITGATSLNGQAGLGYTAGALVTPAPVTVKICNVTAAQQLDWPVTYFAHVFDTEVYFLIHYGVDRYAYLAFGQSPVPGLPGKGVWISGFPQAGVRNALWYNSNAPFDGFYVDYNGLASTGPFWCLNATTNFNSYVHHGLDGGTWTPTTGTGIPSGCATAGYFFTAQPNAWNSEAVLLPIQPTIARASNKRSMVVDLANARYLRITNLDPEQIITLGTDRWKVYPFYRKNTTQPNGNNNGADHSGTFGWAIRYEGD